MASKKKFKITRDVVLFTAGLLGATHEILLRDDVREAILLLLGGMMGLPAFLNQDQKEQKKESTDDPTGGPP